MKTTRGVVGLFVALALLSPLGASRASAQALDDMWFKLTMNFKAHAVDVTTNELEKHRSKATVYARFNWSVDHYEVGYWAKQTDGSWLLVDSGDDVHVQPNEDVEEAILVGLDPWYEDGSGLGFGAWFDVYCRVKKKVSIKGAGTCWGSDAAGDTIYGYATVTGKSVESSKLPFTP